MQRESLKAEEEDQSKNVLKAVHELHMREEEFNKQHVRDKQEKEYIAKHEKWTEANKANSRGKHVK